MYCSPHLEDLNLLVGLGACACQCGWFVGSGHGMM